MGAVLSAQNNPFQVISKLPMYNAHLIQNEFDELAIIDYLEFNNSNSFQITRFRPNVISSLGAELSAPGYYFNQIARANEAYVSSKILISTGAIDEKDGAQKTMFILTDPLGLQASALTYRRDAYVKIDEKNEQIISLAFDGRINVYQFDIHGNQNWAKNIEINKEFSRVGQVLALKNGNFLILVNEFGVGINDEYSLIIQLDAAGNIIGERELKGVNVQNLAENDQGDLFMSGVTRSLSHEAGVRTDAFILKTNANLNVQWARVLFKDQFNYFDLNMELNDQNELIFFYYSLNNSFPSIYTKMSNEGDVIEQHGYFTFLPALQLGKFGTVYIHSVEENEDIPLSLSGVGRRIITKTKIEREADNCFIIESCLESEAIDVEEGAISSSQRDIPLLDPVDIESREIQTSFGPWDCDKSNLPASTFDFVDTLCIGACDPATNYFDDASYKREWRVMGPNGDAVFEELSPEFCFDAPGDYIIRHTIWNLDCPDFHERKVHVLAELESSIIAAEVICDDLSVDLMINTSRPYTSLTWSDPLIAQDFKVYEAGTYYVTVTDGYCETILEKEIRTFDDFIAGKALINIPEDSLVCPYAIPFEITLENDFNATYYRFGGLLEEPLLKIDRRGDYFLEIDIEGCIIPFNFFVDVKDCSPKVFIPTAFSPDGNGVNDTFFAEGVFFETLDLRIYDRWGELLHEGPEPWDGMSNKKEMMPGVYFYILEYQHSESDELFKEVGTFSLLR